MATKKTTSYNALLIGVLGLLAVGTWVIFDIIRGLTATTLTEVQQKQLQPLRAEVDDTVILSLQNRRQFDESTLNLVQSREVPVRGRGAILIPTPTVEEEATFTPEASPSATITPTVTPSPTATSSGEL